MNEAKHYTEEQYKTLCQQHNTQRYIAMKLQAENSGLKQEVATLRELIRVNFTEKVKL